MNTRIHFLVLLAMATTSAMAQDVTIHLDSTAQIIRGFGANNIVQWRPDMTDPEIETAFGMDDGQLGFSVLRLRIPPDESQWSVNLPTAQKAHDMGVTIIASPWTPPASMKTNNSFIGGELREDMYQEYADYLDRFNTFMEDNGIPLYGVSIQNEPDVNVQYESCDWTGEQVRKFMAENAGSIGTRVIAPESFQFRTEMSDPMLNDSAATANVDIVGGHIYGGGLEPYPLAIERGKEIWMTEHLILETDYASNLSTAMDIQDVMKADMSAYIWWYIVRFYGPISDGERDAPAKGTVTKRGYMMSQFSRFIRPGFERVHVSEAAVESDVSVTAYKDSASIVIVAINGGTTAQEVTFSLEGGEAPSFRPYVTTETQNVEELDLVAVDGGQVTVELAPGSVMTLVSANTSVSTEDEAPSQGSHGLEQNYPNPFRSSTTIAYTMSAPGEARVEVFDLLGRRVAKLVDGQVAEGRHELAFDSSHLPAGVYVYKLHLGDGVQTRMMTLAR